MLATSFGTAAAQTVVWERTAFDAETHVRSLYVAASRALFAGGETALLRTTDEGATWTAVGPGRVYAMTASFDSVLFAAGAEGVHRSLDGGATWTESLPPAYQDECPDYLHYRYIVRGPDGSVLTSTMEENGPHCKTTGRFYRTVDGGNTWTRPVLSGRWGAHAAVISTGGLVFTSSLTSTRNGSLISRSSDYGATWTDLINLGVPVPHLAVNPSGLVFAGTGRNIPIWEEAEGIGIYRSADDGATWTAVNEGLTDLTITALLAYQDLLFAGTEQGGLFLSDNEGETWTALNDGLASRSITALTVTADGVVFVATEAGIYRSASFVATPSEEETVPAQFSLLQNYPNPFHAHTTLAFTLAEAAHVRLQVYDALGREIALLLDAYRPAGTNRVQFDAAGLPSGVYSYRLTAGRFTSTRRMTLIR